MHSDQLTSSHQIIHEDIKALLTDDEKIHLYQGAYFLLQDNGLYYMSWMGLEGKRNRVSSHHSNTQQYAVNGHPISECLYGTRRINGETCTWFQLERYSRRPAEFLQHTACYFMYLWTGKNIGPDGTSGYTEAKPYVLRKDRIKPEQALRL